MHTIIVQFSENLRLPLQMHVVGALVFFFGGVHGYKSVAHICFDVTRRIT